MTTIKRIQSYHDAQFGRSQYVRFKSSLDILSGAAVCAEH